MKIAVVYYSLEGNTKLVAEQLGRNLGADVIALEPVTPYPTGNAGKYFAGGKSSVFQETPALKPYGFSADAYDLVILGTPLWAWNITPPVRTFLKENDLSGKQVAAFVCCGGGNPERAYKTLRTQSGCGELLACQTFVNALQNSEETEEKIHALCRAVSGEG